MNINDAWKEIKIIVNADINELCNQNRHSDARELENCRDIVETALRLSGYEIGQED